jgi:hypothetical protein
MGPFNALDLRLIIIAIYVTSMEVLKPFKKRRRVKLKLPINFCKKLSFPSLFNSNVFFFNLKKISPYFMTKLKVPDLCFFLFYGF